MPVFIDQIGRKITIEASPQSIISLVPSQTELLFDLGLEKEVTGITKFCIHPDAWFSNKTKVGGTKQLNWSIIHQLKPDLIIANKEENSKDDITELEKHFPVWVSDINNLDAAYEMIEQVGLMTEKKSKAASIIQIIQQEFQKLRANNSARRKRTCCYLIWQNPFMTIGCQTFIHSMLEKAGFINVFENNQRYPETTIEEIKKLNPEILLLSSEPFPFSTKHFSQIQELLPNIKIILVDGEMFSWYGSRLMKAPDYFRKLSYAV